MVDNRQSSLDILSNDHFIDDFADENLDGKLSFDNEDL